MIFDSLRDRVTVSIDIPKSRKRSKQTVKRSRPAPPEPRKRTATPPQTKRVEADTKRVAPRSRPATPRSTPTADTRTYRSTTGGLFYATGRDGQPQGYPRLSGVGKGGRTYYYWISLDERGDFMADVYDDRGKNVLTIPSARDMRLLIDYGYMKHRKDVAGLEEYLQKDGIIGSNDRVVYGDWSDVEVEEDEDDDEEDGSLADSLADIDPRKLEVVKMVNERLEYLDDVLHQKIRVFCTASKKNPYAVRRLVPDCDTTNVDRQIGMGPKSRAKYFPKHYGVTWEYIVNMKNKQFAVKNRIQEFLDKQSAKDAEKITTITSKRTEREAQIAQIKAEREAKRKAQEEKLAKMREEKGEKRTPTVVIPKSVPEPTPPQKAEPAVRKPMPQIEADKAAQRSKRTVKAKREPEAVAPAPPEPSNKELDSIDADIDTLIKFLQSKAESK